MKKYLLVLALVVSSARAKSADDFKDAEADFKTVMQKLLEHYVDKNLTKDELYRAATAGMLESLNQDNQAWNKLLSPTDLKNIQDDLSGKVSGIGINIKLDEATGFGHVLQVLPATPSEKAGIKKDDQILSVDGKRYKGKHLIDLASDIRGQTGQSVAIRILRDDKILNLSVKRETIEWTPVELTKVDASTYLLNIGYFTEQTPKLVEEKLKQVNQSGARKLIVDLRDNSGGGFTQAIKTAELFVGKEEVVASTKDRDHKIEKFKSSGGILDKTIQVLVLANHGTFCAAELMTASLKENRGARVIGETTFGKWNAQTVETLPNGFAVKYTVMDFQDAHGESYQGVGVRPDLEVSLPKDVSVRDLQLIFEMSKRLALDTQLKAAFELAKVL